MIPTSQEVLAACLLFFIVGTMIYILDRSMKGVYRWWYDMTHRDPLEEDRGFIFNRRTRTKFTVATIITTIQTGLAIWLTETNLLTELILWPLSIPILVLGFYTGPFIFRIWDRRAPVMDKLDELERGDTSIGHEIRELTTVAAERSRSAFRRGSDGKGFAGNPDSEGSGDATDARRGEPADPYAVIFESVPEDDEGSGSRVAGSGDHADATGADPDDSDTLSKEDPRDMIRQFTKSRGRSAGDGERS